MEKVIAVIVTYNRIKLLKECLNAVLSQTYKVHKIVLIDNASTDGTVDLFIKGGEYDKDVIDYRKMETNLGGAGGFYEGIKICRDMECDYVWIMDDDTIPYTDCLEELMSARSKIEGKIGYLASSIIGPDGEPMNVPAIDMRPAKMDIRTGINICRMASFRFQERLLFPFWFPMMQSRSVDSLVRTTLYGAMIRNTP